MHKKTELKKKDEIGYSICPAAKKCGGCTYQGISYGQQLREKQKQIQKLLGKFGKVQPVLGMKDPFYYRNKVHAAFDRKRNGEIISGIYQEGSHQVIPVESCMIEDQQADRIIGTVRELLKSFRIRIYDEDTGYGLFRHVLIRKGFASGEIMVVLVLSSPVMPSKNNFVKALRKKHPEITTVVLNVNDRNTSMVLGERNITLYGPGFIMDTLCGCRFRISPSSFYQVNPIQTEILYNKAMELAGLTGHEVVLDAYCGIGTIGLIAAKKAEQVIGVELNKSAVRDAIGNARGNGIRNARFYQGDAGAFMVDLAEKGGKADVVFMDPPRAGSDEAFLSSVVKLAPEKVVYISCNPETQARDLKYLTGKGYRAEVIQPVDLFPFTVHVESVVLLSHKSPDSVINIKVEFGEGDDKISLDAIAERSKKYQPKPKITYKMVQEYVEKKYGFRVYTAYIAAVKRSLGLTVYDAPDATEKLKQPRKRPPKEKAEAITKALKYFEVI